MLSLSKAYSACFILTNSSDNVKINYLFQTVFTCSCTETVRSATNKVKPRPRSPWKTSLEFNQVGIPNSKQKNIQEVNRCSVLPLLSKIETELVSNYFKKFINLATYFTYPLCLPKIAFILFVIS